MKKLLSGGLLLIVVVFGGWSLWNNRDSTFRYRLTVNVESEGKIYSGSGVIQVHMHFQEYWSPPATPHVTGDAVIVDVPGHQPIFALLIAPRNASWDAEVALRVFQDRLPESGGTRRNVSTLASARMTGTVPRDFYPTLVSFRDPKDPTSVYELQADDLSPALGSGAHVVSMTIEMTRDGVTSAIEKRLPWIGREVTAYLDGSQYRLAGRPFSNSIGISNFRKRGT